MLPKISVIMMVSQPDKLEDALYGLKTAIGYWDELLVAVAPGLPQWVTDTINELPKAHCFPGTLDRSQAGLVRFSLLDVARGDWIINVDDDDIWVYFPWLELLGAPHDCGFIYGDSIFFWEKECGGHQAGELRVTKGGEITSGTQIPLAAGSHWLVRRSAWKQISKAIDRRWEFSDFRLIWYLLKAGWRVHHVPRVFGIVRVHKWVYGDRRWSEELADLEAGRVR